MSNPFVIVPSAGRAVSPELAKIVLARIADPRSTSKDFTTLADLAEREGAAGTAAALRARAVGKRLVLPPMLPTTPTATGFDRVDAVLALPPQPTAPMSMGETNAAPVSSRPAPQSRPPTVPIPGVALERWKAFEQIVARGKPSDVSPSGRFGIYGFSPKRLQDLGLVATVKKVGAPGRWEATWQKGMSQEKFLADVEMQRKAFRRSMRSYAEAILGHYQTAFGKTVGGKPVSLSGLLAVAHIAGAPGLDKWITDRGVREKFPSTTTAFLSTTGIF